MERKSEKAYQTEKAVFASRLKRIMEKRGLNQTHLQEKILEQTGKTLQRQTISLYMNGQSKPDTERLLLLCNTLGVSADYLIGLSDYESPNTDLQGVCRYTGLTEEAVLSISAYSKYDNSNAVISTLNSFLCSSAGYDFFLALWFVGDITRTIHKCLKALSLQCDDNGNNIAEFFQEMEMDLYGSLYRLSDSAASIATEIYNTGRLKKELSDHLRNAEEEEFSMRNGLLMEDDNGKHKEN